MMTNINKCTKSLNDYLE